VSPLKAGPVWDFNLGFGNADYYDASVITGWQCEYELPGDYWSTPFWWIRLKHDPEYYNLLVDSWKGYRNTILSDSRVEEVIDSLTTLLADAQQRNFNAFPILSTYIWPNNYVGGTYQNEINYLKQWIFNRMAWIDSKLDKHKFPYAIPSDAAEDRMAVQIFPNPVVHEFDILLYCERGTVLKVVVYNVLAQQTYQVETALMHGAQTLHLGAEAVNKAMPTPGIYYINLLIDKELSGAITIIKQ
jgi:hypothetical protein